MIDFEALSMFFGVVVVGSPLALTVVLGTTSLLGLRLAESTTIRLVYVAVASGLMAAVAVLATMLIRGTRHIAIDLGDWVEIPGHYHFSVKFVFDRLSVPFAILSFVLSDTIGAFAGRYMHRERDSTGSTCSTRSSSWGWS